MIAEKQFLQIIDKAPLVSIDLIIEDQQGEILLGKRVNRPAQGYWFVPGGRIRKNETIAEAFTRITQTELGHGFSIDETLLYGSFDHIYDDNFLGEEGINTHYVVLAYKLRLGSLSVRKESIITDAQHEQFRWWSVDALLSDVGVHPNTKAYFKT